MNINKNLPGYVIKSITQGKFIQGFFKIQTTFLYTSQIIIMQQPFSVEEQILGVWLIVWYPHFFISTCRVIVEVCRRIHGLN